ncbi:hypothetical protein Unana1_03683 [Umbelopsis nana]
MGNKPSSSSASDNLLSTFTTDEQAQIKQQYSKAVGQSTAPDKHDKAATLPRRTFENIIAPHVDAPLLNAIASYLVELSQSSEGVITQQGFIRGAHAMSRESKTETVYSLYTQTTESLHQFVVHVANTAIPIWWHGSMLAAEQWDSTENSNACKRLADYLVYSKPPRTGNSLNEQDIFATTDTTATWSEEATHSVSADTFSAWLSGNMEFNVLLDILIRSIFWPEAMDRDKARTQHYLAPAITSRSLPSTHSFSNLLTPFDYFALTLHMPVNCLASTSTSKASPHRAIFSSKVDGNSWQNFANRIINQGAILLVIKTTDGDVFGGYADEPLQLSTRWTGNQNNFLYRLDALGLWDAANGTNDHYQYLCWGKKSLPNGKYSF